MVGLSLIFSATLRADPPGEWFEKDSTGLACASCHSRSGFEIKGMAREDIFRRGLRHLDESKAKRLAEFFASQPRECDEVPLQPGGEVLASDDEFLARLAKREPWIFNSPIQSLEDAEKYRDRVLQINVRELPVAIRFSALSEDQARGAKHASLSDWIPDVPVNSDADLDTLHGNSPIEELSIQKYRSLRYLEQLGKDPSAPLPAENPFWKIGELAWTYAESDPIAFGLTPRLISENSAGPSFAQQMSSLNSSWFWLGWIFDPSLTHSGLARETLRGDYFVLKLTQEKLPSHALFAITRKLFEQKSSPKLWEFQYSFLLTSSNLADIEPKSASLFRKLAENSLRASLFLFEHDLKSKKRTFYKVPQSDQVRRAGVYLSKHLKRPAHQLVNRVLRAIQDAEGN